MSTAFKHGAIRWFMFFLLLIAILIPAEWGFVGGLVRGACIMGFVLSIPWMIQFQIDWAQENK